MYVERGRNAVSHILDFEVIGGQLGVVDAQDQGAVCTGGNGNLSEQEGPS